MRFATIWSMPTMSFAERLRRTRDWLAIKTACAIPLRVRFWVTMLELGKATMDSENVPATPLDQILRNLDAPKSLT